ncbi:aldehyde dehydrogenase family protein [Mycobacterium sp. MUNTM1]
MTASSLDAASRTFDRHYIGGVWTRARSSSMFVAINPATEEPIGAVPAADAAVAEFAITAARQAFDEGPWPHTTPQERASVLRAMATIMRRRQRELVELDIAETGRARYLAESIFVDTPISHWEDMANRVLPTFAFAEPQEPFISAGGIGQGVVRQQPYGVAVLVTPFNAPFFLGAIKSAAALAAGCTVVLKPSPLTPISSFLLAEIADEVGLPPGVFNVICGDVDAAQVLTAHESVDIVSFTGSGEVGKSIYSQAAPTVKKLILELGGKSANIVCEDADLTKVVPDVLANLTVNCGQGCALMTRTVVHESVYDDLVAALLTTVKDVSIGDPNDPAIMMGPLISDQHRERVERLIAKGVDEGATLAFGGRRPQKPNRGFFLEPAVFIDVENSMSVAREEIFGPVTAVIKFSNDDEAIRLANDSAYGLAGGVWSRDTFRAYTIGTRLRVGYVSINGGHSGLSPHSAFGGFKASGFGREWGSYGLSEFLQTTTLAWPMASG